MTEVHKVFETVPNLHNTLVQNLFACKSSDQKVLLLLLKFSILSTVAKCYVLISFNSNSQYCHILCQFSCCTFYMLVLDFQCLPVPCSTPMPTQMVPSAVNTTKRGSMQHQAGQKPQYILTLNSLSIRTSLKICDS